MDIQVTWKGIDITNSVIEYSREEDICTGFGTVDMTVEAKTARDFRPWETIVVYENSTKMHTYNIASAEEQIPGLVYVVTCQDDSKRLTDYFIDDQYTIDYPSTAKYWIVKFLTEAGVSYNFNVSGNGSALSENTTLGITSAYDAILQLLQLSGWYFYFDADNVCQIGKLNTGTLTTTFQGDEVLKIGYVKNDKLLRNRAVVWGTSDKDGNWIFADTSKITAWNRDAGDYRTVVYANGLIKTFGIAYSLAATLLNEFSQTIPEKTLEVVNSHSEIFLGCVIQGITTKMTIKGLVTHITINMSSGGLISTYVLDRKCPRLFGYVNWNDYIYIGTQGNGVWRKWVTGSTWSNYSTGITDLNIKDLSAYDGTLGAISLSATPNEEGNPSVSGRLYVRHTSMGAWLPYNPGSFTDYTASGGAVELSSGIIAEACSIDRNYGVAGMITAGFTIPGSGAFMGSGEFYAPSGNLSWIQGITTSRVPVYTQQIIITSGNVEDIGKHDFAVIDLETNWDGNNIISVFAGKEISYTPFGFPSSGIPGSGYGGDASSHASWVSPTRALQHSSFSRNTMAFMPPPTSGEVLEVNRWNYTSMSGIVPYYLDTFDSAYVANYILEDSLETNGIYSQVIINSDLTGNISVVKFYYPDGDGYLDTKIYDFESPLSWEFFDLPNILNFWKIDDNHFSLLHLAHLHTGEHVHTLQLELLTFYGNDETEKAVLLSTVPIEYEYTHQYHHWDDGIYGTDTNWYAISNYGQGYNHFSFVRNEYIASLSNWYIETIDMTTGIKSSTLIHTGSQSFIEEGVYTRCHHTPNYIYYMIGIYPSLPIYPPARLTYTWHIYLITVNKNTWNVDFHDEPIEFILPESGDIYAVYSNQYGWYKKRAPGMYCLNENPDSGGGYGKVLAQCDFLANMDDSTTHEFNQFVVITFYTPGLSINIEKYVDEWYFAGDAIAIEANKPWYLELGSITGGLLGGWEPTFSRNLTDTPILMHYYYPTYDEYVYYQDILVKPSDLDANIVNPIDLQHDYKFETQRNGEFPPLWEFSNLLDDEDNSIYATFCFDPSDAGFDGITYGYNLDGTIRKTLFVYYDTLGGLHTHGYCGGNVIQNKTVLDWTNYDLSPDYPSVRINFFYNPMLSGYITQETYKGQILFHNPTIEPSGLFNIIYEGTTSLQVDTSRNIPTVIYSLPEGLPGSASAHLGASFLNELNSFIVIYPSVPIHDVREFDLSGPLGSFPASGVASGFLSRYIGVAGGHKGLLMFESELPNSDYTLLHSGAYIHLDFTNTFEDPYIFASSSGTGVASGRFEQRNTEEFWWHDYSATLPSGMITIIRADDRM